MCKICGFHGGDYEECRLLGYNNPVHTSQETHYFSITDVSSTESSQLMLYKIYGFRSGDYKECRLLGYKYPVRISQETHYVSATDPSRLMLCMIWGFHDGDYEEYCLLGCDAVWLLLLVTDNVVPSSLISSTLMMEAIHSYKMLVLTRTTWCHISKDSILHSGHVVWGINCVLLPKHWSRQFGSLSRQGCLSLFYIYVVLSTL
jgi:hypothetical protein